LNFEEFPWSGAAETAEQIRFWSAGRTQRPPEEEMRKLAPQGDRYDDTRLLELTNKFDATDIKRDRLTVDIEEADVALAGLDSALRDSLKVADANVRAVAEAQAPRVQRVTGLFGGQTIVLRDVAVNAAGIYVPGGMAAYPSSVLMCAIPARVAGVQRLVMATPPGPDGKVNPVVLAAAALAKVDEIYAVGGAQAIFALAYGSDSIEPVDAIAGPGNAWVREAKRMVSGKIGIDSLAGPSELMVVADEGTNLQWAAFDLCAQAEHGGDGPLIATAVDEDVLQGLKGETLRVAESKGIADAPLALVKVPSLSDAISLANAFAPEHLELLVDDAPALAENVTTAGCVFAGPYSATAFGDYVAGSNHVLPTGGDGRFSGPLGPDTFFRRKIATVEITAEAAAKLAPHVDRIARAEGFPVHGESAMIRTES